MTELGRDSLFRRTSVTMAPGFPKLINLALKLMPGDSLTVSAENWFDAPACFTLVGLDPASLRLLFLTRTSA